MHQRFCNVISAIDQIDHSNEINKLATVSDQISGYVATNINVQVQIEYIATLLHGPLTRYAKLRVAHAPGISGTFSPPRWVSDPDMHYCTCVTHVLWCMPGSLTSGFLWSRRRGKRSRHSRRMRNLQFYVYGKRPIWSRQSTEARWKLEKPSVSCI